jgi:hypothetical protein
MAERQRHQPQGRSNPCEPMTPSLSCFAARSAALLERWPAFLAITRVVRGTGMDQRVNEPHPDTGHTVVGTIIPDWEALTERVREAAAAFPGIRTQSWDVALSDCGPVLLEVNYGGDLNLG